MEGQLELSRKPVGCIGGRQLGPCDEGGSERRVGASVEGESRRFIRRC